MVRSVEADKDTFVYTKQKLKTRPNLKLFFGDSAKFLSSYRREYELEGRLHTPLFFLDAHFYNPDAKPEDKWVVLKELTTLEDFRNCIIMIHDFKVNGLGHLVYNGEPLDMNLVGEQLHAVNPDFHYYGNTRESCDITTEADLESMGIRKEFAVIDNLRYARSHPSKTFRGILYATPQPLDLTKFNLVKLDTRSIR